MFNFEFACYGYWSFRHTFEGRQRNIAQILMGDKTNNTNISVIYVNLENLIEMKSQMALRGNWKEVTRINKMISMRAQN